MNEEMINISTKALQEIYMLYELSITIGQSLNLNENCEKFIKAIHSKKNLDFVSVWIKNKWLLNPEDYGNASMVSAMPQFRVKEKSITLDHDIFHLLHAVEEVLVLADDNPDFQKVITEKNIERGIYAIYPMGNLGFIKLYSSNKDQHTKLDFQKLNGLIQKFAISIEACIAHQSSVENEQKISKIINSSLDAVVIVNAKGAVTHWNSQAEKTFGWTKQEVLYKPMHDFIIPDEYISAHVDGMANYFKTGHGPVLNQRIEITAKRKSGEIFDIELTVIPIVLSHTTIFGSFLRDITEVKKAKAALIEARENAEASSLAKERFMANMSHEFRTPLNAIMGMGDLLKETALNDVQSKYLKAINRSSENLAVIVNDILDISKIEQDKLTIEKIGFNFQDVINGVYDSELPKTKSKGIDLKIKIDPNIDKILKGDPVRLNQMLLNLVNNAIKFTQYGQVELICDLVSKDSKYNELKFVIKDSGIGIDKENLSSIFESFAQADDTITRRFGGTGLGLAIVKKLVEIHEASIEVESEKGKGTSFTILIKYEIGSQNDLPISELKEIDPESLVGLKVLLVEDHDINQVLAQSILNQFHIEVDIADNGLIAVNKLKDQRYDLVLMDMQMPEMDGLEATSIIRNELKLRLPIIGLSANAIESDQQKCLDAGMNDFITKPFKSTNLLNKITHYTKGSRSPRPVPTKSAGKCPVLHGPVESVKKPEEQQQLGKAKIDKDNNLEDSNLNKKGKCPVLHGPIESTTKEPKQEEPMEMENEEGTKDHQSKDSGIEQENESNAPLYSLQKLRKEAMGNEAFVTKMSRMFVDRIPDSIEKIVNHHEEQDWPRVYAIAHKLKPSIDMLDIHSLKPVVREIENAAKNVEDLESLPALIDKLKIDCLKVVDHLKQKI